MDKVVIKETPTIIEVVRAYNECTKAIRELESAICDVRQETIKDRVEWLKEIGKDQRISIKILRNDLRLRDDQLSRLANTKVRIDKMTVSYINGETVFPAQED